MILRLVIFLCLVIIPGSLSKHVKILGGRNANIEDYPFMARLRKISDEKTFCNGVIITKQHILTAAHCFDVIPYNAVTIHTGSSLNSDNVSSFAIKEIEIHPEYKAALSTYGQLYNDIAVAELYACLQFNKFQNKINLPIRNIKFDDRGEILGWGSSFSEILQVATTTILKNEDCILLFPLSIVNNQICTYGKQEVGTQIGDGGGPLINNNGELIGIASTCNLCTTGKLDIYSRVYFHLEFIMSAINVIDCF